MRCRVKAANREFVVEGGYHVQNCHRSSLVEGISRPAGAMVPAAGDPAAPASPFATGVFQLNGIDHPRSLN